MLQKEDKNLLPGLDWIILIIVFILGVSFSGLLLPMSKTSNIDSQEATMLPYLDDSSNESLQFKNVKFNLPPTTKPSTKRETCEDTNQNLETLSKEELENQNEIN